MTTGNRQQTLRYLRELAPGGKEFELREPLAEDESHFFNRALVEGVIAFRDCAPDCPRLKKWGVSGPDEFVTPAGVYRHLFSAPASPTVWLNREYVPHVAAYARAILDFGYDRNRCSFSLYRKFSRDLITKKKRTSYETDVEFYDGEKLHLQIEVKASDTQVVRIVKQIEHSSSLRDAPISVVKEIEYVLDIQPSHLWVVGPESIDPATSVYALTFSDQNVTFVPLRSFPSPSGS